MMYILTLVLEDHSGVIRSKVKVDRLVEPFWKSDSVVMTVFLVVGLFITLLLLSKYIYMYRYIRKDVKKVYM